MNTIELTDAIVLLVTAAIGFLVTNGLKAAFPNVDISGVSAKVTAGIVMALVTFANFLLSFVPAQYHDAVTSGFALIISLLGAFGIHYTLKAREAKARAAKA